MAMQGQSDLHVIIQTLHVLFVRVGGRRRSCVATRESIETLQV